VVKPEYNYALVLVDKYSRWPMAYLKSLSANTTCEALMQVFMKFAAPEVIIGDCGSNFTSELTRGVLCKLGCTPKFNTPGDPEAAGLVERCNQSIKGMIFKLAESKPSGWHKLLPFVLRTLRGKPNATTHISPFTLVCGRIPRGPLFLIKDYWFSQQELPFNVGKGPEDYLGFLKKNWEIGKEYADFYSEEEQRRYSKYYTTWSTDTHYQLGEQVLVLAPKGSKLYCRWHD
jgi:transposase InsO family protein